MQKGKLTPLEDEFKKVAASKRGKALKISKEFCNFWELYDGLYQTHHLLYVKKLYYIAEQNLTEISYEVYVEDRTLYGYRIKYMDLFVLLSKKYNYIIKSGE